jgi:hypothetical protein
MSLSTDGGRSELAVNQPSNDAALVEQTRHSTVSKVKKWMMVGVVVPLSTAIIGAGATISVAVIQNSKPTAPASISSSSACSDYERYILQPLIEKDPQTANKDLESGSVIDELCGLSSP